MIREVPLAAVGLMTPADVADRLECSLSAVEKWIGKGLLPVVVASSGHRAVYLVREQDVDAFKPPPRGRPPAKVKEKPARKARRK